MQACLSCGGPLPTIRVLGIEVVPPRCPDCGTAGRYEEDRADRDLLLERFLVASGGTPRLLAYTLASHPDGRALAAGHDWLVRYRDGTREGLWVSGPVGTGKTGLAWAIVRTLVEDAVDRYFAIPRADRDLDPRLPALFLSWADLLDDLKSSYDAARRAAASDDVADPVARLETARRIAVLALDDLGRERPTPWALEQLAGLVEGRYQRALPTVVTSNYSTRELAERLGHAEPIAGERIVSRLLEGATGLRLDGESRRRPATPAAR